MTHTLTIPVKTNKADVSKIVAWEFSTATPIEPAAVTVTLARLRKPTTRRMELDDELCHTIMTALVRCGVSEARSGLFLRVQHEKVDDLDATALRITVEPYRAGMWAEEDNR
jgi:hypothetical protein